MGRLVKALQVAVVWTAFVGSRVEAAEYYVAPEGADANPGTLAQPFATIQKGHDVAQAGDTVWIRGGTYHTAQQIKLSKSGASNDRRIEFFAYRDEHPVIDFSAYVSSNPGKDMPGVLVTGSWLHLKGLEVVNVPGKDGAHSNSGVRSEGASNNTFERLDLHHHFGSGLFIVEGQGGNLVLDCDSHDNYDKNGSQGDGQNGDGFGVHNQKEGPSTVLRGCRAWWNADDGFDLIGQERPVLIESSWAVANGFYESGAKRPRDGAGNGFKAGSSTTGARHVLRSCLAWKNVAAGFYANHSLGGNDWYNNTAYSNGKAFNLLATDPVSSSKAEDVVILTGERVHRLRNNLAFPNENDHMEGADTQSNSWDLALVAKAEDFRSTSDAGYQAPRASDGSLPTIDFLRLAREPRSSTEARKSASTT